MAGGCAMLILCLNSGSSSLKFAVFRCDPGGLDRLIFTAGIGERAAPVRRDICNGLNHLGITLDEAANATNARRVSTAQSSCAVEVVSTDEEMIIARQSAAIVTEGVSV